MFGPGLPCPSEGLLLKLFPHLPGPLAQKRSLPFGEEGPQPPGRMLWETTASRLLEGGPPCSLLAVPSHLPSCMPTPAVYQFQVREGGPERTLVSLPLALPSPWSWSPGPPSGTEASLSRAGPPASPPRPPSLTAPPTAPPTHTHRPAHSPALPHLLLHLHSPPRPHLPCSRLSWTRASPPLSAQSGTFCAKRPLCKL